MMFWNHAGEVELYSIFVALPHTCNALYGRVSWLQAWRALKPMSAWHSPAPVFVFFALSLSCFLSFHFTVSLLSVFFFIQLPLFLCLRFLPLTLFSLFLILALTSIPPFFRSLFQQEKGNVGGPSPTGNTLVIAFWSLWHDKVCQAKAAQLHAQKDTRAHTHSKGKKCVREKQQTHWNTSPDKRLAQKDSQINTAAAVVSKQQ